MRIKRIQRMYIFRGRFLFVFFFPQWSSFGAIEKKIISIISSCSLFFFLNFAATNKKTDTIHIIIFQRISTFVFLHAISTVTAIAKVFFFYFKNEKKRDGIEKIDALLFLLFFVIPFSVNGWACCWVLFFSFMLFICCIFFFGAFLFQIIVINNGCINLGEKRSSPCSHNMFFVRLSFLSFFVSCHPISLICEIFVNEK